MRKGTAKAKSTEQTTGSDAQLSKSPARVPVGSLRASDENNGSQAALPDSAGRLPAGRDSLAGYHPSETGNLDLRETTMRLVHGENLSRREAANFLDALLDPIATDTQIAAALIALTAKGETVDELTGMAEAMRERATPVHSQHERFIDTAGTGSSAVKRFNVSTAAAFVIAGAGLPVAKHGARAASSASGSADVLEALGVNTAASPNVVERCLNDHGICFIFAPLFHRATGRVARVRRNLGVHTTFNLLGPLTNPARAPFQLVGVWDHSLVERVASVLALLGVKQAWVVHGADGLDEVTIAGETFVAACSTRTGVKTFTISPEDFGLKRRAVAQRREGPAENARLTRAILGGERNGDFAVARDLVVINAAAALYLAGVANGFLNAAAMARASIESGQAASKLEALIRETNRS
jgi:anthranilate phosphoribosyltransferase